MGSFDQAHYEVLLAFYQAWEDLHAIPADPINTGKREQAAQHLVEQAHILRRMKDKPRIMVPSFLQ